MMVSIWNRLYALARLSKGSRRGLRCSAGGNRWHFGNDAVDAENGRVGLAEALLSIGDEDSHEVEVLKRAALQRMALDYKRRRRAAFAYARAPGRSRRA